MITILIVDDEEPIRSLIHKTLSDAGYCCTCAADGQAAADLIEKNEYDLALLDIMLPYIDGYDLATYLFQLNIPVIFLTAKGEVGDRVRGLQMGADDYIVKPFEPRELVARVGVLLRRIGKGKADIVTGDIRLNVEQRQVWRGDQVVSLTPKETDLFILLMQNLGKTLFREHLYGQVWGDELDFDTRTLDTHIQRLRRKLGLDDQLKAIYKIGYRLEGRP